MVENERKFFGRERSWMETKDVLSMQKWMANPSSSGELHKQNTETIRKTWSGP